jgi:hypothetical protein
MKFAKQIFKKIRTVFLHDEETESQMRFLMRHYKISSKSEIIRRSVAELYHNTKEELKK